MEALRLLLILSSLLLVKLNSVYGKCKCEDVEDVIRVSDDTCFRPILGAELNVARGVSFFPDQTGEEMSVLRQSDGVSPWVYQDENDDQWYFSVGWSYTGVLIISQGKRILVDSSLGEVAGRINLPSELYATLESLGCGDGELDYVINTHIHGDHTGGNVKYEDDDDDAYDDGSSSSNSETDNDDNSESEFEIVATFSAPTEYLIQYDEYLYGYDGSRGVSVSWDKLMQPLQDAGQLVLRFGDYWLTDEVQVQKCAGHTPGHQCVYIYTSDGTPYAVATGDVIHHPVQIQMPTWQRPSEYDLDEAIETRETMIQDIANNKLLMVATHFEWPNIGVIEGCDECGGDSGYVYRKLTENERQELYNN